jgi:hypothetical protein
MTDKYIALQVGELSLTVKVEDEGLVLDVSDKTGEIVGTAYEFYNELGLQKNVEDRNPVEVMQELRGYLDYLYQDGVIWKDDDRTKMLNALEYMTEIVIDNQTLLMQFSRKK